MTHTKLFTGLAALTVTGLAASTASAATLTQSTFQVTNDNVDGALDISVFDGEASYAGNITDSSGVFGDGTVLDYAFFSDASTDATYPNLVPYAAGSASIIGAATGTNTPAVNGAGSEGWLDVWTTNDPDTGGGAFSTAPNFDGVASNNTLEFSSVDGTIDLTGLTTGSVYLIYGSFADDPTVTATLKGTGQTDIVVSTGAVAVSGSQLYITQLDFDTMSGLYDTLDFSYSNPDADGSRARFGGIVVDGVPEPGSLVLIGMGGMLLAARRRRTA